MHRKIRARSVLSLVIALLLVVSLPVIANASHGKKGQRDTCHEFIMPDASGETVFETECLSLDISNTAKGYIMFKYFGEAETVRMQLSAPNGSTYSYIICPGEYECFPLSSGDGIYKVSIYENVYGNMYALVFYEEFEVSLDDEFGPFLYPNKYVNFSPESKALELGVMLSDRVDTDLEYVSAVYKYIMKNIEYDYELAENVKSGYLPDIDRTLECDKGICFDYSSLMASLLRSQGIPTKLVFGYMGTVYHAWISVYLEEIGWVDNIIE